MTSRQPLYCHVCGLLSGTSLVCTNCRRFLTDAEKERLTRLWHELVVAKGYDPDTGKYRCYHCRELFPRDRVAGDHFPVTKAACPALRFDVYAGKCSCSRCNSGANDHRKESMKAHPRYDLCKRCRFRLVARDGLCFVCIGGDALDHEKIGRGV